MNHGLEPAGNPYRPEGLPYDCFVERRQEKGFGGSEGRCGVVPLVGTGQPQEHLLVPGTGLPQVDQPSTDGHVVRVTGEVAVVRPDPPLPYRQGPDSFCSLEKDLGEIWFRLAENKVAPAFYDPCLLECDIFQGRTEDLE